MHISRELTTKVLFAMMVVVIGAGYYFSQSPAPPSRISSGIEASSCGQFAATYEHNSTDPNHSHDFNAYGVTEAQSHAHVTANYREWLGSQLSDYTTENTLEKYLSMTPSKLAGLLYTMYRVCRANPEQSFVAAVMAVINNLPGLKPVEAYIEGSDGE